MPTSPHGNPIGPPVDATPALPVPSSALHGKHISLVPRAASHFAGLAATLCGPTNTGLWDYIPNGPFLNSEDFRVAFHSRIDNPSLGVVYTIIAHSHSPSPSPPNVKEGEILGSIALININPANRSLEIGFVLFGAQLQRTIAATEVMFLLLSLAFDTLGYRRCEWKCDALNEPSRRAALRLGFRSEGVFRQHMIIKGRNRDTEWFSIVDGEWGVVKGGLERWLEEGNFDEEGRQRRSLAALRAEAEKR